VRARPAPQSFLTEPSRFTAKFEIILSLKGSAASAASRSLHHLGVYPAFIAGLGRFAASKKSAQKIISVKK
jgi:hypothetical protein